MRQQNQHRGGFLELTIEVGIVDHVNRSCLLICYKLHFSIFLCFGVQMAQNSNMRTLMKHCPFTMFFLNI